ncbi:MAG: Crp/Fnr family transcriptional regulator [Bacteriovoracaceae bacterium]
MSFFDQIKIEFLKLAPISDGEWARFVSLFKVKHYKKGEFFVTAGTYSTDFGFIEKGLFRFFYTTYEGEEFNQTFKKEFDYILSFTSILLNEPSNFSIQALEDSTIYVADYRDFEAFYHGNCDWQQLGRKIAELNFIIKTKKEESFLLYNAPERFEIFKNRYPEFLKRVPQMHVASYLGISAETLNRIIKKSKEVT